MITAWVMVYFLSNGQIIMKQKSFKVSDIQAFYKVDPHSYGKSNTKLICMIALNKEVDGKSSYESPTPCKTLEAKYVQLRFK